MIVGWGLGALAPLLAELGLERPLLVTSARFASSRFRCQSLRRREAACAARGRRGRDRRGGESDGLVGGRRRKRDRHVQGGLGGDGSPARRGADDLRRIGVDAVLRDARRGTAREDGRLGSEHGRSRLRAGPYARPPARGVGRDRDERARALRRGALCRAVRGCIGRSRADRAWLPRCRGRTRLEARTKLLEGAMHAGTALAERGLFLAHAMAQALGGRYGVSHGAMNALCLAPALRFNEPVVPEAIAACARRCDRGRPGAGRGVREARRLRAPARLRHPGGRARRGSRGDRRAPAARSNPRPATPTDIEALLRSIW